MILVGENRGFEVYFSPNNQKYTIFKDGKFLIGDKYRFRDVQSYIDFPKIPKIKA
jgi:hypothetical protein